MINDLESIINSYISSFLLTFKIHNNISIQTNSKYVYKELTNPYDYFQNSEDSFKQSLESPVILKVIALDEIQLLNLFELCKDGNLTFQATGYKHQYITWMSKDIRGYRVSYSPIFKSITIQYLKKPTHLTIISSERFSSTLVRKIIKEEIFIEDSSNIVNNVAILYGPNQNQIELNRSPLPLKDINMKQKKNYTLIKDSLKVSFSQKSNNLIAYMPSFNKNLSNSNEVGINYHLKEGLIIDSVIYRKIDSTESFIEYKGLKGINFLKTNEILTNMDFSPIPWLPLNNKLLI